MHQSERDEQALVFNIQRYSIHDGPGIRTIVFLKGCPLHCPWCSNPEGILPGPELAYTERLCRKCGLCTELCATGALRRQDDGSVSIDRGLCKACGACANLCNAEALKLFGEEMTVDAILRTISKDAVFYTRSGGGMTVSGGEPLARPALLLALLREAKERHDLHIVVETSLYAKEDVVRSIIPFTDHVFSDIKLIDSRRHKDVTGVSNERILSNILLLDRELPEGKSLILRFPLIPGLNDDTENIKGTAAFISGLKRFAGIELLPYHEFGRGKYSSLGKDYPLADRVVPIPDKERMEAVESLFHSQGVHIIKT